MEQIELFEGERLDEVNENLRLICKTDGLTFGTDAYLLASFIRPQTKARAAELGTGTGIISLLLASRSRLSHITAIEVQSDFADLADRNIRLNSLEEKITVIHGDVRSIRSSDIDGELDVVFSNPPYMRTDSGKRNDSDRKYIARHEVMGSIGDFCEAASRMLKHGGRFYCVWRPDRLSELMWSMRKNRIEPKVAVFVHADSESEPSMVLIMGTKGGNEGMRILPPLLLHPDGGESGGRAMTRRAERIYETMSFYE